MIEYACRDYYKQQVDEIIECIRQSQGRDTAWAKKVIHAMQGEIGEGKYVEHQARRSIRKDQLRIERLIEAVSLLFDNAIKPDPEIEIEATTRLKGPPPEDPDVDTIALLNRALELLSEPRGSAVRNISTRASKDMKEYFYWHNGEVCKEMFKAKSAKEFQLRFATGKKTAQFLFKRLKPMRNG